MNFEFRKTQLKIPADPSFTLTDYNLISNPQSTLWNVLHDGTVESISGSVPGEIQLNIGIEYLRSQFPLPGEYFRVNLHECTQFAHREYGSEEWIEELDVINFAQPDILCAEMQENDCIVSGGQGVFKFVARRQSIGVLDEAGKVREISLEDLMQVATDYWEAWEKQNKESLE